MLHRHSVQLETKDSQCYRCHWSGHRLLVQCNMLDRFGHRYKIHVERRLVSTVKIKVTWFQHVNDLPFHRTYYYHLYNFPDRRPLVPRPGQTSQTKVSYFIDWRLIGDTDIYTDYDSFVLKPDWRRKVSLISLYKGTAALAHGHWNYDKKWRKSRQWSVLDVTSW